MIRITQKGDYKKAKKYLANIQKPVKASMLEKYGAEGVRALWSATPVDTGLTRDSWYYRITDKDGTIALEFCNSNIADYVPIAIILQYGHATGTGGWVEGRDYINPAVAPVFDRIAKDAWKEITG